MKFIVAGLILASFTHAVKLSSGFGFGKIAGGVTAMGGNIAGKAVGGAAGKDIANTSNIAGMAASGNVKGAETAGITQGTQAASSAVPGAGGKLIK